MPNHIQNRLQILGTNEDVQKIRNFMKSENSIFDFNKITPMPESLNISSSSLGEQAHFLLFNYQNKDFRHLKHETEADSFKRLSDKMKMEGIDLALKYQDNLEKYGFTNWYPWCLQNWGTKWNAYNLENEKNDEDHSFIYFQTAWSSPIDLMQKLSNHIPNITLKLDYADEDTGCNCGCFIFRSGSITESFIPENQSNEAYELAFKLFPESAKYYELVDGKYEQIDEDDLDVEL